MSTPFCDSSTLYPTTEKLAFRALGTFYFWCFKTQVQMKTYQLKSLAYLVLFVVSCFFYYQMESNSLSPEHFKSVAAANEIAPEVDHLQTQPLP